MLLFLFRHFVAVVAFITFVIASFAHFGPGQHARYARTEAAESTSTITISLPTSVPSSTSTIATTHSTSSYSILSFFTNEKKETIATTTKDIPLVFDKDNYEKRILALANRPGTITVGTTTRLAPTTTIDFLWPVKNLPYPNVGAVLPNKRIIAYYGNLYSKGMGVLGEYPEAQMLAKLDVEVKKWNAADPSTEAVPALHYIAVTAQESKGYDGKYRARMPYTEIDKVIAMAAPINALVFIDIQAGLSTVQDEVPLFEKYLKMPNVHLGIDPEFYMQKSGKRPGTVVGTLDASQINWVSNYLAKIVKENNLPPKVFVIHRFTEDMVTNYKNITPLPEVQIVMHMDGWGGKAKKINTYEMVERRQPVQFTGFKLFYKNDTIKSSSTLLSPEELLKLRPRPSYIQYQ